MNAVINNSSSSKTVKLTSIEIDGETFYKISNADEVRSFFMSIVSDGNHWLFVSSNGGVSAGRKNSEFALFPYYTDDKITDSSENTGSKSILRITKNGQTYIWEPFSIRTEALYDCSRNIYKNQYGNKIIFEEINHSLSVTFKYQWCTSNVYGFVRKALVINNDDAELQLQIVDGLQNILPYGVESSLQSAASNLATAYKRNELITETGVGIFALSAIIVDKAEPSEALKANVVWSIGIENVKFLLSNFQLNNFRRKGTIQQEDDVKGENGSYFIVTEFALNAKEEKQWMIVANVNQSHSNIIQLSNSIENDNSLFQKIEDDINNGTNNLIKLVAAADGIQNSSDKFKNTRHYSNVLFNIMRGGIFDNNYQIEKWDLLNYLKTANKNVYEQSQKYFATMSESFSVFELQKSISNTADRDLQRLITEYLPLKFSRRHGDPSRPWNKFSINTINETDGSKILDYEGNWRDIFQNWEALAHSYPAFLQGMIFKFLNASTFDGYNPYRVTKSGFDWETIEPDNPWSYIGYWGDHQIIYLLKFLEFAQDYDKSIIQKLLNQLLFVYANVPYKIKSYNYIVDNPKNTIEYNDAEEKLIHQRISQIGSDGALLTDKAGNIYYVNFCEKILATTLAKLSNFVADGGIWMNTQRPEWNDANNALVGNGLSMVTLCYLRRFLSFFISVFEKSNDTNIEISAELQTFFTAIVNVFAENKKHLAVEINDATRKKIIDDLAKTASAFREKIYTEKFSGNKVTISTNEILNCFVNANLFLEQSIHNNKRNDNLYHTYNLISYNNETVTIAHLTEMLEGQVAVLSSGYLTATQSLQLLNALQESSLYRKDQYSYILYPNKDLPRFLQKNNIAKASVEKSALLQQLMADNNTSIIEKDTNGNFHFNGNFRNANDLEIALNKLDRKYNTLLEQDKKTVLQIFEETFNHKEFTGRSGTFFAYEGLGSIYWHMVSKLLLAVQETCIAAIKNNADTDTIKQLIKHYYNIQEGIGVHKPVNLYGAFPTDPYSHTPYHKGAQQPGMTGQVKEDILCRIGELGVFIEEGKISFNPILLKFNEFVVNNTQAEYITVNGGLIKLNMAEGTLFFTYCQVPVMYILCENESIEITYKDDKTINLPTTTLPPEISNLLFKRTGDIKAIKVFLKESRLIKL